MNYTSHNSHDTTFKAARARSFAQKRREQVAYTGAYDRIDCCRKFERGETQDAKSGSQLIGKRKVSFAPRKLSINISLT